MSKRTMKKGFTLVEILIVVVILGILAAIVIPQFTSASETAKGSSLVSQLQTIRSQLELYQVQHNGDYPSLGTNWDQMTTTTDVSGAAATTGITYGPYLQKPPVNPFSNTSTVTQSTDANGNVPAAGADVGWVYNNQSGRIKATVPTAAKAVAAGLIDEVGDLATSLDFVAAAVAP